MRYFVLFRPYFFKMELKVWLNLYINIAKKKNRKKYLRQQKCYMVEVANRCMAFLGDFIEEHQFVCLLLYFNPFQTNNISIGGSISNVKVNTIGYCLNFQHQNQLDFGFIYNLLVVFIWFSCCENGALALNYDAWNVLALKCTTSKITAFFKRIESNRSKTLNVERWENASQHKR